MHLRKYFWGVDLWRNGHEYKQFRSEHEDNDVFEAYEELLQMYFRELELYKLFFDPDGYFINSPTRRCEIRFWCDERPKVNLRENCFFGHFVKKHGPESLNKTLDITPWQIYNLNVMRNWTYEKLVPERLQNILYYTDNNNDGDEEISENIFYFDLF